LDGRDSNLHILTLARQHKIEAVLNLGAGLDTRPYRLEGLGDLGWIEVDFPATINYKQDRLSAHKPKIPLERVALDLTDREARGKFFDDVAARFQKVLVLTEGVIPYLSNEETHALAADLHAHDGFKYWIVDYMAREVIKYIKRSLTRDLKNSPFRFEPEDWHEFFAHCGWKVQEMRYIPKETRRLGRHVPRPLLMKALLMIMPAKRREAIDKWTGFALLTRD
jgi:methyltransferase (TIGR00027 family)